jgi:septum formation protein
MDLAKRKAESIAAHNPDALVIGADTIVVLGERILEKPENANDAEDMLTALSGQTHSVLTGLALAGPGAQQTTLHCEETMVHFRDLQAWEIQWYIHSGEHADKAGAYGIQGKAAVFVNRIEGCYFNVVGLPLAAMFQMIKDRDIRIENYLRSQ